MTNSQKTITQLERISDYVPFYASQKGDEKVLVLGDKVYTYKSLNEYVNQIAKALLASGIKKGDRVATLSPPTPDYFAIFLATSSIGGIWLGLNPQHKQDEYHNILGDSEPKLIISIPEFLGREYSSDLAFLKENIKTIQDVILLDEGAGSFQNFLSKGDNISDFELEGARALIKGSDTALIVYTSGSTGRPKGALIPHCGLVKCSIIQYKHWYCVPLITLNYLPINHIGCVGDISSFTLVAGGTMVFLDKFDPVVALELIEREHVSMFGGVPTALQMCLTSNKVEKRDLSSVQMAIYSGAAAPVGLITDLMEIFPCVSSSYGMTETVGSVTFVSPTRDINALSETIGTPPEEFDFKVLTTEGQKAQVGQSGEILVRCDFLMNGYWRRKEETAKAIDNGGWLHTGDIAEVLDGNTYKLVGRMTDMFISGGYNIFPREIETVIEGHPDAKMAAVISKKNKLFGEVGVAYVLIDEGSNLTPEGLKEYCRERLGNYKIPKEFFMKTELPMLPVGKIDKKTLKEKL